jgi:hypothetical protein
MSLYSSTSSTTVVIGGQLGQQRLGLLEVIGVEPIGEPVVDFSEYYARLIAMPMSRNSRARLVVVRSS